MPNSLKSTAESQIIYQPCDATAQRLRAWAESKAMPSAAGRAAAAPAQPVQAFAFLQQTSAVAGQSAAAAMPARLEQAPQHMEPLHNSCSVAEQSILHPGADSSKERAANTSEQELQALAVPLPAVGEGSQSRQPASLHPTGIGISSAHTEQANVPRSSPSGAAAHHTSAGKPTGKQVTDSDSLQPSAGLHDRGPCTIGSMQGQQSSVAHRIPHLTPPSVPGYAESIHPQSSAAQQGFSQASTIVYTGDTQGAVVGQSLIQAQALPIPAAQHALAGTQQLADAAPHRMSTAGISQSHPPPRMREDVSHPMDCQTASAASSSAAGASTSQV